MEFQVCLLHKVKDITIRIKIMVREESFQTYKETQEKIFINRINLYKISKVLLQESTNIIMTKDKRLVVK